MTVVDPSGGISGVCKSTGVLQFWGVISGSYLHHSGLWLVLVFRSSDRIYGM